MSYQIIIDKLIDISVIYFIINQKIKSMTDNQKIQVEQLNTGK
jgi:hypothetical protein